MAKKKSLADEVLASVQNQRPGYRSWADKLPDVLRLELEAVARQYDTATMQKSAFCRAISQAVAARGHAKPKEDAVKHWLHRILGQSPKS